MSDFVETCPFEFIHIPRHNFGDMTSKAFPPFPSPLLRVLFFKRGPVSLSGDHFCVTYFLTWTKHAVWRVGITDDGLMYWQLRCLLFQFNSGQFSNTIHPTKRGNSVRRRRNREKHSGQRRETIMLYKLYTGNSSLRVTTVNTVNEFS